jgi:diaminohydroxyphosphoribosylaminopyrimidine deaminase/5-amino-6-(5-phosphoribosylamino)uracil reductase
VARSGVRRVYIGHLDPHRAVSGRGVRRLRREGIEVRVGVLERECREQHRGFLSVCARGRPFVSLKLAGSLDGRIATSSGESRWITGVEARALVHRLRARSDALLVGSGTAIADDPELTARRSGRVVHRPVRVVWDARLRVPTSARLFQTDAQRTWVLCAPAAAATRRRAVEAKGARVIPVPARGGRLIVGRALAALARAGLTEVLVEGGGELAAALLRTGCVDELHWFVAPRLLGADARAALGPLGVTALADAVEIDHPRLRRVGGDVYLRGSPRSRRARAPGSRT